ncbi:hypothetical protein HQ32_04476 [Prauserella sp. Am3]|nr:hypothetical protein HQ32_04476 [Prauserella sp. Am3]
MARNGQAEEHERAARRKIAEQAEEWRAVARRLPFWDIDRSGDEIVLRDELGPLATLHGPWAPHMADFLQAMNTASGLAVAELLWRIGGHGGSADIRREAENVLRLLRLDEVRRDR